jgi:hypothetical protein
MNMPTFNADASLSSLPGHWTVATASPPANQASVEEVTPAGCAWYDRIYAPVACGFVDFNESHGTHGYGQSPCTCWQIPLDPVGCALLPKDRNRNGSIPWCEA